MIRFHRGLAAPAVLALCLAFASRAAADPEGGGDASPRWWKGNTHTHSLWSDGNDFPDMIAKWYKDSGYHFLVLSDHNVLSRGERWMKVADVERRRSTLGVTTLKKYLGTFGDDWVELRGEGGGREVRLKTLPELRGKLEESGRFLMVEGEEITDRFEKQEVHTNAINLTEVVRPQGGASLRETMRNNLRAALDQGERLGRPVFAHLNHPNFRWSITAEDIAHVTEERFFEVYNGHPGINHLGDLHRPGDERIWDIANTIRAAELGAPLLYGVATDDAHHYHGGSAKAGRGWIMVRAESLEADALVGAITRGDFYATSGVVLSDLRFDAEARALEIEIEPEEGVRYTTQFIGTRRGDEGDPDRVGVVLAEVVGASARYVLGGDEWYVRATVTSDQAHPRASFEGQMEQAWVQPVPGSAQGGAPHPEPSGG